MRKLTNIFWLRNLPWQYVANRLTDLLRSFRAILYGRRTFEGKYEGSTGGIRIILGSPVILRSYTSTSLHGYCLNSIKNVSGIFALVLFTFYPIIATKEY